MPITLRFEEIPNSGGDFWMDLDEKDIDYLRNNASYFISMLGSSPVKGDYARVAYWLWYEPKYFLNKTNVYSHYTLDAIQYFNK